MRINQNRRKQNYYLKKFQNIFAEINNKPNLKNSKTQFSKHKQNLARGFRFLKKN